MDRADWLRITAAFGLALISSESAIEDVRDMYTSARDAFVVETATDRSSVNLEPMNVGAMLSLPYVEGTRQMTTVPVATRDSATTIDTTSARASRRAYLPVAVPAPTYSRGYAPRGIKRYTS
ncbi:MAG: hypothetical protein H7099_02260 [Gemmatimonadaceae bacterium]|nr:hypothetical protein [Gemmatimonadaceae bacterium]